MVAVGCALYTAAIDSAAVDTDGEFTDFTGDTITSAGFTEYIMWAKFM